MTDNKQLSAEEIWNAACTATLKSISQTFLDKGNHAKADRLSDMEIFQALGETIVNFPMPEFPAIEFNQDDYVEGLKKLLRIAGCPELLIEYPNLFNGKPSENDFEWAKQVIEKYEEANQFTVAPSPTAEAPQVEEYYIPVSVEDPFEKHIEFSIRLEPDKKIRKSLESVLWYWKTYFKNICKWNPVTTLQTNPAKNNQQK